MGLYLRKAFIIGPFRINLSKSGFGLSFGVTGARVGIGPNGPYLHAGREFIYYKKSLKNISNEQEENLEQELQEEPVEPTENKLIWKKLYIYMANFLVGSLLVSLIVAVIFIYLFFDFIKYASKMKHKPKIKRKSKRR